MWLGVEPGVDGQGSWWGAPAKTSHVKRSSMYHYTILHARRPEVTDVLSIRPFWA
jgi:hypothetical protein